MKNGLRFKLGLLEGPPCSIKLLRATCVSTALIWLGSDWCLRTVLLPNDMKIDVHGLSLGGVWVWAARGPCLRPRSWVDVHGPCYTESRAEVPGLHCCLKSCWCWWAMLSLGAILMWVWPGLPRWCQVCAATEGHVWVRGLTVAWIHADLYGSCYIRGSGLGPWPYCNWKHCLWSVLMPETTPPQTTESK